MLILWRKSWKCLKNRSAWPTWHIRRKDRCKNSKRSYSFSIRTISLRRRSNVWCWNFHHHLISRRPKLTKLPPHYSSKCLSQATRTLWFLLKIKLTSWVRNLRAKAIRVWLLRLSKRIKKEVHQLLKSSSPWSKKWKKLSKVMIKTKQNPVSRTISLLRITLLKTMLSHPMTQVMKRVTNWATSPRHFLNVSTRSCYLKTWTLRVIFVYLVVVLKISSKIWYKSIEWSLNYCLYDYRFFFLLSIKTLINFW